MAFVLPQRLDVYRKAFDGAMSLHKLSLSFPKIEQYGGIADQMRRSSKSICANIAEGLGKHMSSADKRKFIQIAMGSAVETKTWLEFAQELEYLTPADFDRLYKTYDDIAAMLFGLMGTVE